MNTPSARPTIAVSMPRVPKPNRPMLALNMLSTSSIRLRPIMPKTAAITNMRNLLPTLMSNTLYAASVPAKAANVPITAPDTTPSPNCTSKSLLRPPSATPSRTAKAITSAGLITRLNELTIESTNAPREPSVTAATRPPLIWPFSMSGVSTQVASAATITRPSEIAVFWTTESIVIGPRSTVGTVPGRPGWPGVPVPQVAGSE